MLCIAGLKKTAKKFLLILLLLAVLAGAFAYYMNIVYPLVRSVAEAKTAQITTELIENACQSIKPAMAAYGNFYSYEKNSDGEVVLAKVNSIAVNQAYIMIKSYIYDAIKTLDNYTLDIPVGAFSGLSVFADEGSDIPIKIMPIGNSEAEWISEYKESGVNQTIHRVIVKVNIEVEIVIPVKSASINVCNEFVVAEDLIIGRVPESYITGATEDDTFDLLP